MTVPTAPRAEIAWPHVPPLDTTAAGAARGVMRLAEMCDAVGIKPAGLHWIGYSPERTYEVHVYTRRDLDRLADHLGLPADVRIYGGDRNGNNANAERVGVWRDMAVAVFSPAITPDHLKAGA